MLSFNPQHQFQSLPSPNYHLNFNSLLSIFRMATLVQDTKNFLCISVLITFLTMSQLTTLQTVLYDATWVNFPRHIYMITWPSFSPSMTANALRMIMHSSPAFSLTSYPLCCSPTGFLSLFIASVHAFPLSV